MSNVYPVYKDDEVVIELQESSCRLCVNFYIQRERVLLDVDTKYLTTSEMIDLAVNILGPLHYFVEKPETILPEFVKKIREKGFV